MMWTRRQSVIFMAVVVFVAVAGALALRFVVAQEVGPKSCITKAECPSDQYCIANRCNVPPPVWNGEGITGFAPQAASFSITGGGAFGGFDPDPQWRVTTPSIYIGGGAGQAGTTIKDGKITTDQDAVIQGKLLRSDQLTKHGDPDYYFKATNEITIDDKGQLWLGTVPASKIVGALPGGGAVTGPWLTAANDSIYYKAGSVGIGTNNPVGKLHVQGTSDTTLKVETTTTSPFNVSSLSLYHGAGDDWSLYNEGGIFKIVDLSDGKEWLKISKGGFFEIAGAIKSEGLCLQGVCKESWSQAEGGTGGSVDECSVSIFKNASSTTSNGVAGGYTGANSLCGSGKHVCTTEEVIKSIRCGVSLPASGSMWVIEGPPGYTAAANDCMGWQSNSASHFGAYWDFGGSANGGVGWMTVCSSELPFACCQ